MINELELVQNNGTKPDPLAQAKALIAQEQQTRIGNVLQAMKDNGVEARAVVQIGENVLLPTDLAGLPVIVQLVAK